jgi:hypothetical protein
MSGWLENKLQVIIQRTLLKLNSWLSLPAYVALDPVKPATRVTIYATDNYIDI